MIADIKQLGTNYLTKEKAFLKDEKNIVAMNAISKNDMKSVIINQQVYILN